MLFLGLSILEKSPFLCGLLAQGGGNWQVTMYLTVVPLLKTTYIFHPFSSLPLFFCVILVESFKFSGCPLSPTLSPALAFPQPLDAVPSIRTPVLMFFLFVLLMYLPFLNKHFIISLGWMQVAGLHKGFARGFWCHLPLARFPPLSMFLCNNMEV